MWRLILPIFLGLMACDTPSEPFRGQPVTRVAIGGNLFDIRIRGRRAEAIRINARWAPNRLSVADAATRAITAVSGCRVAGLGGDQAMITARLDCGQGAPPPVPPPHYLDCDLYLDDDGFGEAICRRMPG